MKRVFISLLCLVFLCPVQGQGLRVLFIGDSITDGSWGSSDGSAMPSSERNHWDWNHLYGSGYMYLCAAYYQSEYPGEYQFFNRGISGNALPDLAKRWDEDAIALKPDVLSLLVGTNDIHYYIGGDMAEPFDTLAWERDYRALLDRSLAANPQLKLVLGAPFTAFTGSMRQSADFPLRRDLVCALARIVERVAEDYGAVFVPYDEMFRTLLRDVPTSNDAYWLWDGIHPTPAGHKRMSELWIEKVSRAGVMP